MLTPYLFLLPVALLAIAGAHLSFNEPSSTRTLWIMPALSASLGLLWAFAIRYTQSKEDTYVLSLWWDVIVVAAYTVLPVVAFGVELNRWQAVGVALVVVGLIVVKGAT